MSKLYAVVGQKYMCYNDCKYRKRKRLLRLLLLGIFLICMFRLGQIHLQSVNQRRQQEELKQMKQIAEDAATEQKQTEEDNRQETEQKAEYASEESEPVMLEKYEALYEANNDMAGWLTVEGTNIDYPVMQCSDIEYYLRHDFYGDESRHGCPFVTGKADLEEGTNFIIYAHNMKDDTMFGTLDRYLEEDFYREHPTISFDTLYEERMYEIVAAFRSQVYYQDEDVFKYYQFYQADTQEEFENFYRNIKNLSLYDTGVEAEYGDVFLTLSTCSYHVEDGRFVVVAKRVQ